MDRMGRFSYRVKLKQIFKLWLNYFMFRVQMWFQSIGSFESHRADVTLKLFGGSTFKSVMANSCVLPLVAFPTRWTKESTIWTQYYGWIYEFDRIVDVPDLIWKPYNSQPMSVNFQIFYFLSEKSLKIYFNHYHSDYGSTNALVSEWIKNKNYNSSQMMSEF